MTTVPSGPGQTDKDHSLSVVAATDSPDVVSLDAIKTATQNADVDLDAVKSTLATVAATLAKLRPVGALTSASAGASNKFVIPITTSSVAFNLAGANYTNLLAAIVAGKALKLKGDGDVFYRWGTATGTVDETKTAADTPLNQAEHLFAGEREDVVAPDTATWIMVKGPVATFLRITISEL
jgi:hypothetical protein